MSGSGRAGSPRGADGAQRRETPGAVNGRTPPKKRRVKRSVRVLTILFFVIIALSVSVYAYYKLAVRPPDVKEWEPKNGNGSVIAGPSDDPLPAPSRDKTKYTFLVLGTDDGNGNTDTMMVATFDATNYTLNVVNIPRDTLVNVPWYTKKANSLLANSDKDPNGVITYLKDVLGYPLDFYVVVDLDAFSTLVDAIDGVYFDVPKDMNYEDPVQDLYIHLEAGPQLLDGEHALQLVRARQKVWNTGDIGRIETQQAFLKAAAEQILANKSKLNITELVNIFLEYVDTDLDLGKLGWFAKEFLKMDSDKISLEMIPANYNDNVNGNSYCTIYVNDWLEVLNTKLNPFDKEIKATDLSILTRGADGKLYATDGVIAGKASWGSGGSSSSSGGSSSSGSNKPDPSPSVSETEEPDPSPSDTASPDPSPSTTPGGSDPSPSDTGNVSPSPEETTEPSPSDTGSTEPSPDETPVETDPAGAPSDWVSPSP
jgi:LCP family protein required for cell wall assembly